jgi:hypothetical protein
VADAGPVPKTATTGTGVRTMAEISSAPPPPPLVREYLALHHGEACVIFGPGGSTKGTTAAWLASLHVREDPEAVVLVLDFEHHEAEWGGRLRRLGATENELRRIHYASPYSAEWTAPRGLLTDVVAPVRADCERLAVSLLIVDSITTASASGEAMGGQQAATEYFDALAKIGRRSLSLAHVKGDAQRWPDRPFGSVHIHNLARETWAIAVVREGSEDSSTHGLTSAEVELRCKKANGRRKPRPQVITYTYEPDYGAITVVESERKSNHGDLVYDALHKTPDLWLNGKRIVAAIVEDTGEKLTEAQVYDAIRRDRKRRFESDTTGRPFKFKAASS